MIAVLFMDQMKYAFQQFADGWLNKTLRYNQLRTLLIKEDRKLWQFQKSQKAGDLVKSNTRYTAQEIANMIGILKGATLKMKKKCACWVPSLLQESQKHARLKRSNI